MKILVITLSGIGDALMFTPAILKLKEDLPDCEIDAMVMYKGVSDIFENIPQISRIHYFNFLKESKLAALKFVLSLRGKYDISVNAYPSNRIEYNGINFLIGAPMRAGVNYLRKDLLNFGFLNNIRITEDDSLHNVEENIKLVEQITRKRTERIANLQFPISGEAQKSAEKFIDDHNIGNKEIVIGFHPGCSSLKNHDNRRWSTDNFAKLADKLIIKNNAVILIFGGPEESYLKEEIKAKSGSGKVIAVNTNSLAETAAIMKRCNVFVTNDSSLMHVASAMQLNVVAIIGPTNANYIRPWQTKHNIASINLNCAPCFYYSPKPLTCARTDRKFKCVKELPVELVFWETQKFL